MQKAAGSVGIFYDVNGKAFDLVRVPDSVRKFPFRGSGFYAKKGKVTEDFGVLMVEVNWMDKLPMVSKRADKAFAETITENPTP